MSMRDPAATTTGPISYVHPPDDPAVAWASVHDCSQSGLGGLVSREALGALAQAWEIHAFDPQWGRKDIL